MTPWLPDDRPAIVTLEDPVLEALALEILAATGYRAVRPVDDAAALGLTVALPVELVLTDPRSDRTRTRRLVRDVLALRPDCRVLIVHRGDDGDGMWDSLLAGGHPCRADAGSIRASLQPWPPTGPSSGREVAVISLLQALAGRPTDACVTLSALARPIVVDEAIETLVDLTATALRALPARELYPVPIEVFEVRLGDVDRDAYVLWWSTLQYAANRAAGLDLPLLESELELRHRPRLWAAHRVAEIVVTVVAQRQGLEPSRFFAELAPSP